MKGRRPGEAAGPGLVQFVQAPVDRPGERQVGAAGERQQGGPAGAGPPAGQAARGAATLSQVAEPDVVVIHRPVRCRACERPLDRAEVVATSARQVFDVPDPKVVVTEHRAERRRCVCGCETTAVLPAETSAPACYGQSIKAHALYCCAPSTSHGNAAPRPCRPVRRERIDRDPGQLVARGRGRTGHLHRGRRRPAAGGTGRACRRDLRALRKGRALGPRVLHRPVDPAARFPTLGLLRSPRLIPGPSADGGPSRRRPGWPAERGAPGWFSRSPRSV